MLPTLHLIISILTFIVATWLLWRKHRFSYLKKLGIPGPEPSILFGNFLELSRKGPLVCHREWVEKYGNIVGYYFGTKPVVLVNDPELLKKIQISDFHKFINRATLTQFGTPDRKKPGNLMQALIKLRDKRWKDIRSILTPSFTTSKMKLMAPIINNAVETLLERIDEKAISEESFDIYDLYQGLTMDVIGRTAFGIQTECQKNPEDEFLNSARTLFMTNISSMLLLLAFSFPELSIVWRGLRGYRFYRLNKGVEPVGVMTDSVVSIIRERRKDEKKRRTDLLQLMIDANMSESDMRNISDEDLTASSEIVDQKEDKIVNDKGANPKSQKMMRYMTDDEIVQNALLFFLAGYETTSTALAFVTHLLIHHQDVQDKVREEINDLMAREGKLDYGSVQQLQYLDQVITEAIRLYPSVYLFVNREVAEDVDLGSVHLKKGLFIQINAYLLQHDQNLWDEPEKFDPDRFSPENKAKNNPLAFQAFGAGPRNCVGLRFAQMEEKLALARILHKYKLVLCNKSDKLEPSLDIGTSFLKPKHGVFLKAVKL